MSKEASKFKLNVEAAERYLTNIPLLSLNEEPLRSSAPTNASKAEHGGSSPLLKIVPFNRQSTPPVLVLDGTLRSGSSVHDGDGSPSHSGLDIAAAERFLLSLELEEDKWVMNAADRRDRAVTSTSLCNVGHTDTGQTSYDQPEKWHTVVGGWRNRSDLNRLMPGLIRKGLVGSRIVMSTRQSSAYICSTLPYVTESGTTGHLDWKSGGLHTGRTVTYVGPSRWWPWQRRRQSRQLVTGISYASSLKQSDGDSYNPDFLDDQSLRQGKHHTVLSLEAYQVSVIPFVRPRRLKEELNAQFRALHPTIHPSLTLSKLRNLQKDLREMTLVLPELDISTVAMAWVFFDKLVLGHHVQKANRKLLAGACLVLAFKFNQHGDRALLRRLAACIRKLDRKDQLNLDDIHDAELKVFVWLEFGLHLPWKAVIPHMKRFLKDLGISFPEYLAESSWCLQEEDQKDARTSPSTPNDRHRRFVSGTCQPQGEHSNA